MKQNSRNLSFPISNCPPDSADTIGMGIVNFDLIFDDFCGVEVMICGQRGAGIKVER